MGQLIVDQDKCKKDGICAGECPLAIIKLKNGDGFPEMVPGGDRLCLVCGHCVAVCPHGALSHTQVPVEACPVIEKNLEIDDRQMEQFLRARRSIRFFKDDAPDREALRRLIEIARYAPTGGNSQMLEWLVLTDRAEIRNIAGKTVDWMREVLASSPESAPPYMPMVVAAWDMGFDAVLRDAPALVVASAPREANNGMVEVALALCYFELAAPRLGLGTCWAGLLQGALLTSAPLRRMVGIPEGHPHHYPMMVGITKSKYYRLPERKAPRITWK